MSEAEYAEYLTNLEAEDPQRCDATRTLLDEDDPERLDPANLHWCSKPWGHQYHADGANLYHAARNDKGQVWLQWPDETQMFLRR